ncbi:hypothetical protein JGU71_14320 [Antrihabitans sp. YC3-6]|uniref:Uncharacterized protein n=1 Tax=Antrihabitans stalagmiti TaxID=2799499 RepID=A0A934U430_9NOCA|nr:hypothetical protein [Antrihabitans stalagmiti]MBJ8340066.1 hypothetical protein [Antrihabitans stalagmiti]
MTEVVDTRAELVKLSRILNVDVSELAFLETVGWQALREFRQQATDQFFVAAESRLKNLAAAAKLVPNPVIVKLAPKYFEPRMAAAVASLIDEDKALKLVPKLPVGLMADASVYIDPRRVGPLISKVPIEVAQRLAPILLEREEFITLGQFIDFVTPEMLAGLLPVVDDISLLRIAEVTENKAQLNVIMPLIDDARIGRTIQTAKEAGMLGNAVELLTEVSLEVRGRMVNVAAQQSDSVLDALVHAVHSAGSFAMLLPTTTWMEPQNLARFAKSKAFETADVMKGVVAAADRDDLWAAVVPLVPNFTAAGRREFAAALGNVDGVEKLVDAAAAVPALFPLILPLATDPIKERLAAAVGKLEVSEFERIVQSVIAANALTELLPIVPMLPKAAQERVSDLAANFDPTQMREALVDASENGVLPELLEVAAGMPLAAREQTVGIISDSAEDDDLLGVTLEPDDQQNVWNQLLKLADDVPLPALEQLSQRAAFLPLDGVMPSVLKAAEATNEWTTSFAILSGIHKRAESEGVPLEFTVPARLIQMAAEKASETTDTTDSLWFAKALLAQYAKDDAYAKTFDDTAIHASAAVRGAAESAVQVSMGLIGEGTQPIRSVAAVVPGGKTVTDAVTGAADLATGLASSLFGRAKAASKAVSDAVAPKDPE